MHIHTDLDATKVRDVRAAPFAALHVWDPSARLQVRVDAHVTVLKGQDVDAIWAGMSAASRLSYGSAPAPGQPISAALEYEKVPDFGSFAVLQFEISKIDALHLDPNHRRARFDRDSDWAGTWLVP